MACLLYFEYTVYYIYWLAGHLLNRPKAGLAYCSTDFQFIWEYTAISHAGVYSSLNKNVGNECRACEARCSALKIAQNC